MRLAIVTDGIFPYSIGGMQKHSYFLVKFLSKYAELDLYHCKNYNQSLSLHDLFPDTHQNIHEIAVDFTDTGKWPLHYLNASKNYSKTVFNIFEQRPMPDIVICKGFTGWEFVRQKKNNSEICPVLVNFHGYEMFQESYTIKSKIISSILRPIVRNISKGADYCFSYGGKITELLKDKLGIHESHILEFPSGIESNKVIDYIKDHVGHVKFCFVGRNEPRKGIFELTAAIKGLVQISNWSFDFVGPIPEHLQIKADNIFYHGLKTKEEDITSILQKCDVIVCPSWSEGMPNVILEAMANGLAVLATDTGATSLLVNNETGWLLSSHSPVEIKNALIKIVSIERNELNKKRERALSKIKTEFVWDSISDHLISRLRSIGENGRQ